MGKSDEEQRGKNDNKVRRMEAISLNKFVKFFSLVQMGMSTGSWSFFGATCSALASCKNRSMVKTVCVWLLMEDRYSQPQASFVNNFNEERLVRLWLLVSSEQTWKNVLCILKF